MTSPSDLPTPAAGDASAPRPYEAPALTTLGSIEAVTAGPDKRPDKNLDMIIGSDGGFFSDDATS